VKSVKSGRFITEQFATTDEEIDALLGDDVKEWRIVKTQGHKILLVGAVERAFSRLTELSGFPVEVRSNVQDAIDTAAKEKFSVIAVVVSGLSARLKTVVKALNESCGGAKIVLLVQMYEEPIAKRLMKSTPNGRDVDFAESANSYLICPIEAEKFYQSVLQEEPATVGGRIDEQTSERIRQLEKLATTDELTGLKNRRYMWEFSRQIMDLARAENSRVTLLVFDIDDFKHYNDKYGHSTGDNILKQAAVLMQKSCREHDVVGRIGGDEFAVVFWDGPRKEGADESSERRSAQAEHPREAIFIAKRFQKALEGAELNLLGPKGRGVLTISGGLASFPRDGSTVDELFEQADKALLEAKRSGKNRIYLVGSPQGDISKIE
jgi:diguanylate cyclase (GGDEF)-like protein